MKPDFPFPMGHFRGHSLQEQSRFALMNRVDSKFMMSLDTLKKVLNPLADRYSMLEINGLRWFTYDTLYFDTKALDLYHAHHNGKLNRFKIRTRHYLDTGSAFLEIKFKNNLQRTIKRRVEIGHPTPDTEQIREFIHDFFGLSAAGMLPALFVRYKRATLIGGNQRERITVDVNLEFSNGRQRVLLPEIALIEVKSQQKPSQSPIATLLRQEGIRSLGFSKYCIGTSLVREGEVKTNRFKPVLGRLEKLQSRQASLQERQSGSKPTPNLPATPSVIPIHDYSKETLWNQPLISIFSSA